MRRDATDSLPRNDLIGDEGVFRRPAVPKKSKLFSGRCLDVILEASHGDRLGRLQTSHYTAAHNFRDIRETVKTVGE